MTSAAEFRELVLVINRDLYVVARDGLACFRQKPGVCIGRRELGPQR